MGTKINILRGALFILLIITFIVIFNFSNQNGEKSGGLSREITEDMTKNVQSIQKLEENEKNKVLKKIEHIIRKTAHLLLYTLIGIITMSLMCTYNVKGSKRIETSLIVGVVYAVSDEIHQIFIPDRTASIIDVGIDSCGVLVGSLIVFLIFNVIKKFVEKNECLGRKIQ